MENNSLFEDVRHQYFSFLFLCYFSDMHMLFYLFISGCAGSLLLHVGFLWFWRVGAALWLQHVGFLLQWLLLLQSTGCEARRLQQFQHAGSVVVAYGL